MGRRDRVVAADDLHGVGEQQRRLKFSDADHHRHRSVAEHRLRARCPRSRQGHTACGPAACAGRCRTGAHHLVGHRPSFALWRAVQHRERHLLGHADRVVAGADLHGVGEQQRWFGHRDGDDFRRRSGADALLHAGAPDPRGDGVQQRHAAGRDPRRARRHHLVGPQRGLAAGLVLQHHERNRVWHGRRGLEQPHLHGLGEQQRGLDLGHLQPRGHQPDAEAALHRGPRAHRRRCDAGMAALRVLRQRGHVGD